MPDAFHRFAEVDAVLAAAFELPPGERRAYVESTCAADSGLREDALRLLASSEQDVLHAPDRLAQLLADAASLAEDDSETVTGALAAGSRFGAYLVLGPVGAGGMGEVYRARDTRLGREVALKVLPNEFAGDTERLARFEREARILASLNHPRINAIHELEEDGGRKALVLELVDGRTLAELLEDGALPVERALEITRQIAEALDAAHRHGVLHRDLKPANVRLTEDGQVKVLDFGLAKSVQSGDGARTRAGPNAASHMTMPGRILGTAPYMSPEQLRGGAADARSDIWALGCLLYEMLTGTRAFGGTTAAEAAAAVLEHRPDLSQLPDRTPPAVRELVASCLNKDPDRRPTTASQIAGTLDGLLSEGASQVRARLRLDMRTARLAGLAAFVALLAILIATVLLERRSGVAPIDSIVVLPFENTSDEPDSDYLSDGITDGLINSLSKLPNLRVVPRGIAYAYSGRHDDPARVAAELGVRALLTGRVGEHEGSVIVGAELTDANELAQLWGEQYTYASGDLLKLREDLVSNILEQLRIELTPEQRQRAIDPATENPEAYRLFLKARYHTFQLTPEDLDKGLEYAREAIDLDPSFAPAYVNLSAAHMTRAFVGREPWAEAALRSRAATKRALELDDSMPEAHAEQGFGRHHFDWDWAGAERSFRRALELDPENWEAYHGLSESLLSQGRESEAVAAAERAVELAPFNPTTRNWLAICYRNAGRFEDALRTNDEALELEPTHLLALDARPVHLLLAGREQEALELARERVAAGRSEPGASALLAVFHAWLDNEAAAGEILTGLDLESMDRRDPSPTLALALALVGERDRAFELLDRLLARRSRFLLWLNTDPLWKPVHDDPRFQNIMREMSLG